MTFNDASVVDGLCYNLREADYPRATNRTLINNLANGLPPYTDTEVRENGIEINTSNLSCTRLAHDARQQFYGAFMKPGNFFSGKTDYGPKHKRQENSTVVTKEINRIMKRSPIYFETTRSKIALEVLHGIGSGGWDNRDFWCPDAIGIEDVLMPSGTLLTMKNIPYFVIHRSYSSEQLRRLTSGPNVDPGWNIPMVNRARKWVDEQATLLMSQQWPEIWSPEKSAERLKGDGGFYAADCVPCIEVFDFYFWNDEGKVSGWNRRMILDAWSAPDAAGKITAKSGFNNKGSDNKDEFLYNPGKRKYGSKISEIIGFQFADLSAVAPFQYHSVRSLGFLIYGPCHLENRLHCKFNEAVFENLQMYLRVKSLDDAERALKIELVSKGIIDETVQFLSPGERWQVNEQLAELGIQHNARIIQENSASYVQNNNFSRDKVEKTKFQVMAEVNAQTALISAALLQAYQYQTFEYYEILRRFMKKNSRDPDVREFRNRCLKQHVPEDVLVAEAWEIEPERVLGSGNKTAELTAANLLLENRSLYDPEPQREILRRFTLAVSDDPGLTDSLVPRTQDRASRWTREATQSIPAIMDGLQVRFETGANHIEVVESWLGGLTTLIEEAERAGGMAAQNRVAGMVNMIQHIAAEIQLVAKDDMEKERARRYSDALGQLLNFVKGYRQRLEEQQAAQNGKPELDPEQVAKIQIEQMKGKAKIAMSKESHAVKTAQKQVAFELQEKRKQEEHQIEVERQLQRQAVEDAALDIRTASEIRRENKKASAEESTEAK